MISGKSVPHLYKTHIVITKQTIKYLRSLSLKKYRDEAGRFVAEGPKTVADLGVLMKCERLFATADFLASQDLSLWKSRPYIEEVSQTELSRLSSMQAPHAALAVFEKPQHEADNAENCACLANEELCIALEDVQDPGNLGTIMRVADWFGISHIFASPHTADAYAPKVVQATMGAIGRVNVHYLDLQDLTNRCMNAGTPVYGTFLDGDDIYKERIDHPSCGIILMGNEGSGISSQLRQKVTHKLYIPNFPQGRKGSESLNVAIATALVCAEFRRRLSDQKSAH